MENMDNEPANVVTDVVTDVSVIQEDVDGSPNNHISEPAQDQDDSTSALAESVPVATRSNAPAVNHDGFLPAGQFQEHYHTHVIQHAIVGYVIQPKCVVHLTEKYAMVQVLFRTNTNEQLVRNVYLQGDDYTQWGKDDTYIDQYVRNNISDILNNVGYKDFHHQDVLKFANAK